MILDSTGVFSDSQAITASAASTNIVDLGATGTVPYAGSALVRDIGKGRPLPLRIQVTEAFNNLTSLAINLESDDNTGFSSPKVCATQTINLAGLTLGAVFEVLAYVPVGTNERYLRLNYTVAGTAPTLGRVTGALGTSHSQPY